MLEAIRWVTVHPALVHFTLGTLPVLILAYGMAAWRRSERWTFVGDVTLVTTATLTLATAAFGLVANWALEWPGGLATWRWLHMALGAATTVLLVFFAAARLRDRRRGRITSGVAAAATAVVTALLAGSAGWVGGEVLVFHSGMGVRAAAGGALAPPITARRAEPADLLDAMHAIRAAASLVATESAKMIVEAPSPDRFDRAAEAARRIREIAEWLAAEAATPDAVARVAGHDDANGATAGRPSPAEAAAGRVPADGEHAAHPHAEASELAGMAQKLAERALAVEDAAVRRDLPTLAIARGRLEATCAACHELLRRP